MTEEKKTSDEFALPEGRVINQSLFKKDQFNEKAVPSYRIELAFPAGETLDPVFDKLMEVAVAKWGEGADKDENLIIPIKNGDKLAKRREDKGKTGEAYAGHEVIRASTIYNRHGEDGPGGVQVFDENVETIEPVNAGEQIYNGVYGRAGVVIGTYEDQEGNHGLKFYLTAFQKTRDGDRLATASDHSRVFEKVGRTEGAPSQRRSRAG